MRSRYRFKSLSKSKSDKAGCNDHHARKRIDNGRDAEAYHRIDVQRQRRRPRTRHEKGDDEVFERHRDSDEKAREDARQKRRNDDFDERLEFRRAQIVRRFDNRKIEFVEARFYHEIDEGQTKCYVRGKNRKESERYVHSAEKYKCGNADDDFGQNHRKVSNALDKFPSAKPIPSAADRRKRAEKRRNGGRRKSDDEAI